MKKFFCSVVATALLLTLVFLVGCSQPTSLQSPNTHNNATSTVEADNETNVGMTYGGQVGVSINQNQVVTVVHPYPQPGFGF